MSLKARKFIWIHVSVDHSGWGFPGPELALSVCIFKGLFSKAFYWIIPPGFLLKDTSFVFVIFLSSISFIFSLIQPNFVISNLFCLFFLFLSYLSLMSTMSILLCIYPNIPAFLWWLYFLSSASFLSSRSSCFISFCGVHIIFPELSVAVVNLFIVLLNSISPELFI